MNVGLMSLMKVIYTIDKTTSIRLCTIVSKLS